METKKQKNLTELKKDLVKLQTIVAKEINAIYSKLRAETTDINGEHFCNVENELKIINNEITKEIESK